MTPSNPSLTLPHRSARSDKGKSLSVRWLLRFVSLFSLMFVALPAQAANYVFSDTSTTLPPGCIYVSPGIYSCGVLTLGADDTISIGDATPATIIFTGALTTGPSNLINAGGSAADLTLVTIGVLNLGVDTIVNADVFASAAVNLGDGSLLNGNLETASPTTTANVTGVVTLGANSSVNGYILTDGGAVTVGASGFVGGRITTQAGVVTLGADVEVLGGISTGAGAVTVGDGSRTVGGGITTEAGVVTLTTNVKIDGDISTIGGAITIGARSSTCGSVISTGAGVVTLGADVKIGGSINSIAGAITVNAGSTVGGDIISTGAGVVTLTAVDVGGQVATIAGAITMTDSRIGGPVEATGAGVVTITNSMVNDSTLDVPPSPACSSCVVFYSIDRDARELNIVDETTPPTIPGEAPTLQTIQLWISPPHAFGDILGDPARYGPGFNGLATDPTTGTLYGIARLSGPDIDNGNDNRSLVTINPTTGEVTFVGSMGGAFSSIVFDDVGTLYGSTGDEWLDLWSDALHTVNKGTGEATFVMDLYWDEDDYYAGYEVGHNLAFNTRTGFLYHLTRNRFSQIDLDGETEIPVSVPGLEHNNTSRGIVYDEVDDLFLTAAGGEGDSELYTFTLDSATNAVRRALGYMDHKTKGLAFARCPDLK
ncbi:MAG: hypothetical protein ACI9VS_002749 [Candidatus Binatia bacterium]|jgi:hypothetical protein